MLPEAAAYKKEWQLTQSYLRGLGENCAFVYVHLQEDTGEPFYVGIGEVETRPWDMKRSEFHGNVREKHGVRVEIIAEGLSWETACWWEQRWIKALRGAGYRLVNMTDGGEGSTGFVHTEESRALIKQKVQSRVASPDFVPVMKLSHVKQAHLESTQSDYFKDKQRKRIKIEGNILDRPRARENHLAATQSEEFRKVQRQRMIDGGNPMATEKGRENYYKAVSAPEYKANKLASAPRGDTHYMSKDPDAGRIAGKRLKQFLTPEIRAKNAQKGWVKRFKRHQYWGA